MSTDLKANYQGVYENRIGFGKRPAILLVDFVQAYFDKTCDLYAGVEDALASAIRVRDGAHRRRTGHLHQGRLPGNNTLNGGRFFPEGQAVAAFP
jgi:maleamate amidohydrolase